LRHSFIREATRRECHLQHRALAIGGHPLAPIFRGLILLGVVVIRLRGGQGLDQLGE
jgi:hypothetical protein